MKDGVLGSWLVCLLLAGCARSSGGPPDGRPLDAAGPLDAAPDGAVAQAHRPGSELVVAAGRVGGGAVTIELEIGHWVDQGEATAGSRRLTGAAVVLP